MSSPGREEPAGSAFAVARVPSTGGGRNTVNLRWEERRILYFHGYEFHPGDPAMGGGLLDVPNCFERRSRGVVAREYRSMARIRRLPIVRVCEHEWTCEVPQQRVKYRVRVSRAKNEFRAALQTPGALVFYAGHARYGRGPCFGEGHSPFAHRRDPLPEPYGDGRDQTWGVLGASFATAGCFRMGLPYIGVPIEDVVLRRYSTVLATEEQFGRARDLSPADCDGKILRGCLDRLELRSLRDLDRYAQAYMQGARMHTFVPLANDDLRVWTFRAASARYNQCVVAPGGWGDLADVDIRCRALVMVACASFTHFHHVVRNLKGWRRTGDERLAYWLSDTANIWAANYLLYHLLTWGNTAACQPWAPWLEYAVRESNRWLAADEQTFRVL